MQTKPIEYIDVNKNPRIIRLFWVLVVAHLILVGLLVS